MKIPTFLKTLIRFCDSDASRFALGGVKCESRDGLSKLTATDGRVLACVSYPDAAPGAEVDLIANGKSLSSALTASLMKGGLSLQPDGHLSSSRASVSIETVDGRFPRYEDVFSIHEDPSGYVAVKVDPHLLKRLCELHAAAQNESARGLVIWAKNAQSPIFTSGQHLGDDGVEYTIRGVLMPLAADDPAKGYAYPARPQGGGERLATDHGDTPQADPESTPDCDTAPAAVTDGEPMPSDEAEPVGVGSMGFDVPEIE